MGAWSTENFGNDTAGDWADELTKTKDLRLVDKTLAKVLDPDEEYLDSDDASEALAACEVVARLKGHWGLRDAYSEEVDKWVERVKLKPTKNQVEAALAAIDRILAPESELRELWEEGDATEWLAVVADLRRRVGS